MLRNVKCESYNNTRCPTSTSRYLYPPIYLISMTSTQDRNSVSKQNALKQPFQSRDDHQSPPLINSSEPTIALLPACNTFEEFHDTIGVSLETFKNLDGGWLFGYVNALKLAGVQTVIVFFSVHISETLRFTHPSGGAKVCVLPASKLYRAYYSARRQGLKVAGVSEDEKFSQVYSAENNRPSLLIALKDALKSVGAYLSTPLGTLAQELRREGCQAILCQEYEFARFDACVLLGRLMRLPVFATFQGGDKQQSFLESPLRQWAVRACTGLLVAPAAEIQRVRDCYGVPSTKVARIFNPMQDLKTWVALDRAESRAALNIPLDAQVVVFHGRMEIEYKGLDILLDAWEQVCRDRPDRDLRLLLVGTGSDANELAQRIANMQLRGVMRVDEFVRDRLAIRRYLSAADVYTLASRKEGFPVAPIEAMACSLPVVATDAPGVRDILEQGEASGGLVVPRCNPNLLALGLGRVLDDQAWGRELGNQARHRVEECFHPEVIGRQMRQFLLGIPASP